MPDKERPDPDATKMQDIREGGRKVQPEGPIQPPQPPDQVKKKDLAK